MSPAELRRNRAQRRGSFVAGSKIERFDNNTYYGTSGKRKYRSSRRSSQESTATSSEVDQSYEYEEMLFDHGNDVGQYSLQQQEQQQHQQGNLMTNEQEKKQQLEFEKMRMELGYEDMEVPNARSYDNTNNFGIGRNEQRQPRRSPRRASFVAGSRIERFDGIIINEDRRRKHRRSKRRSN
jgi:hypothetical protein